MKGFLLMLTFLTRIPIHYPFEFKREDFIKGIKFVPFIGLIIGLILWVVSLTSNYFHKPVTILLIWTIYIWTTGGLHIDGLADTVDGIFSNRDKERILEIMKDSRIGTFGVLSIILVLGFNIVLSNYLDYKLLILIPIMGRCSAVFSCSLSKYARVDGLGKDFIENCNKTESISALLFMFIAGILLGGFKIAIPIAGLLVITILLTRHIEAKIGGITGDTIGFVIELSQSFGLLGLYIIERI